MKKQNLKLALIVAAVGVAAQSQAALESITYTESPDSGNFPPVAFLPVQILMLQAGLPSVAPWMSLTRYR